MFQLNNAISYRRGALLALLLIVLSASTFAQAPSGPPQPPWGPAIAANGTYTINWLRQGTTTYLQEKVGAGTWVNVSSSQYQSNGGASYSVTYTNKPAGEYSYRLNVAFTNQYGTIWYNSLDIRVSVYAGPAPSQDLMSNQLGYTYSARIGDINADLRPDVFIQRTAGGLSGNGTLDKVILRRQADGSFNPDVPTATQVSTASAWPVSNTLIELTDVNVDGYADILLPELGNAISGAGSQLVFSSGQVGVLASPKVLSTGAGTKYRRFMDHMALWAEDPGYFERNAPYHYVPIITYVYVCDYFETWQCWYEMQITGYRIEYDYSQWDQDAFRMRYQFTVSNGEIQTTINPGTTEARNIDTIFRNVFGVVPLRGILGNNCYDYQYDPETGLPCIEFSLILLVSMPTEKGDCRLLTPGEKAVTAAERVFIENVDQVRVCRRTFPVPGGSTSMVVPGDGHIYVGSRLKWREDFSNISIREIAWDYSFLLHELVHVFQVRNGNCGRVCMLMAKRKANRTGGYKYWPIPPGKTFQDHNIEQQGDLVQDRFRLTPVSPREGFTVDAYNSGVKYEDLRDYVPVLQGDFIVN